MRHFLGLSACLVLSACTGAERVVALPGGSLCIPQDHVVPEVPWVKPDGKAVRRSKGVAIRNCVPDSRCLFLQKIENVVVDEDSGFRIRPRDAGFEDSLVGRVLAEKGAIRTIADNGRLLVAENPRVWGHNWFIWRLGEGPSQGETPLIGRDDELLAICGNVKSKTGVANVEVRDYISCKREFVRNDLAISYSFASANRVPSLEDFSGLDGEVVGGLERLRCSGG